MYHLCVFVSCILCHCVYLPLLAVGANAEQDQGAFGCPLCKVSTFTSLARSGKRVAEVYQNFVRVTRDLRLNPCVPCVVGDWPDAGAVRGAQVSGAASGEVAETLVQQQQVGGLKVTGGGWIFKPDLVFAMEIAAGIDRGRFVSLVIIV